MSASPIAPPARPREKNLSAAAEMKNEAAPIARVLAGDHQAQRREVTHSPDRL